MGIRARSLQRQARRESGHFSAIARAVKSPQIASTCPLFSDADDYTAQNTRPERASTTPTSPSRSARRYATAQAGKRRPARIRFRNGTNQPAAKLDAAGACSTVLGSPAASQHRKGVD